MYKNTILILLLCVIFGIQIQANPLAGVKAGNIKAEFVEKIEIAGCRFISVSPDGAYFAVYCDDGRPMIRIVEQGTLQAALETPAEIKNFYFDFFRWSPDSRKAAVTEDLLMRMYDSDLWILDIDEGRTYHLFPDNVRSPLYVDESLHAYAEILPVWSPGGGSLFLSRSSYNERDTVMGIVPDYTQSVFKEIKELHNDVPYLSWAGGFWRENYIYYTWDAPERNYFTDGIYRIKPDGKDMQKIAGFDGNLWELRLADVSRDERYALAEYYVYPTAQPDLVYARQSYYRVINLSDLSLKIFKKAGNGEQPFYTRWALFSPSGDKIFSANYLPYPDTPLWSILLRDADSDQDYKIISGTAGGPPILGTGMLRSGCPLFWTSDDYLFLIAGNGTSLLKYRLSKKPD